MKGIKGAVEMSMGTIVVIVLAVSMLILGMIFVRSIMCSGIQMSEQISEGVQNEIRGLFGANDYGVKCMGESGEEVTISDGGRRQIGCVIKTEEGGQYSLILKEISSLSGVSTSTVQQWVVDKDFSGSVGVGDNTQIVAVLNIPRNTPASTLKLTVEETGPTGTKQTHILRVNVAHVGAFTSAIC
jgi:hypothetical protein